MWGGGGINEKNINLPSAGLAQRVVKVKAVTPVLYY